MSCQFPSHSRTGIPLHSLNVLVLLELWHGVTMYKDISLLWEHNAFPYYFNSMDNITLFFCTIHVTIHFSLKRDASAANGFTDLHTYWQFYSSLNTLSMISLILFAPNPTMALIVMTVKFRLM